MPWWDTVSAMHLAVFVGALYPPQWYPAQQQMTVYKPSALLVISMGICSRRARSRGPRPSCPAAPHFWGQLLCRNSPQTLHFQSMGITLLGFAHGGQGNALLSCLHKCGLTDPTAKSSDVVQGLSSAPPGSAVLIQTTAPLSSELLALVNKRQLRVFIEVLPGESTGMPCTQCARSAHAVQSFVC